LQEEEELVEEMLPELTAMTGAKEIVSFPVHRGGHHVEPVQDAGLFTCPAVIGVYNLEPNPSRLRPCQACGFCLP
jgi:hypothetical protein